MFFDGAKCDLCGKVVDRMDAYYFYHQGSFKSYNINLSVPHRNSIYVGEIVGCCIGHLLEAVREKVDANSKPRT